MMSMIARIIAICLCLFLAIVGFADAQGKDERKAGAAPISSAPVTDIDDLRRAHEVYLNNRALQLERPEPEPIKPRIRRKTPGWLRAIGDFIAGIFSALGPLFTYILYAVMAVLVLALIWFIAGETFNLRGRGRSKRKKKDEDDVIPNLHPDQAAARSLLEEADALAQKGQFAEAVHLLLFRSIEDIQNRQTGSVSRDLTAREIGHLDTLPETPRKALSPIIAIVENSFFGGHKVDETGWKKARASYENFVFGEAWT